MAKRARAELRPPLEPGDDLVGGQRRGDGVGDVVGPLEGDLGGLQPRGQRTRRPSRGRARPSASAPTSSPSSCATWSAAPSAVPESPEAGCTQIRSNGLSRHRRELATQLSATPPAMTRSRSPVRPCSQPASSSSTSSSRVCTVDASAACAGVKSPPGASGGAKAPRSTSPTLEAAAPVGPDQGAEGVEELGRRVGRHRHHLVLVRGAAEAEVRRQLLIEQAERVREPLGGEHLQRPVHVAPGEVGAALPAPVEHEHAARVEARGEGGGRRMGDVMGDPAHAAGIEAGQTRSSGTAARGARTACAGPPTPRP